MTNILFSIGRLSLFEIKTNYVPMVQGSLLLRVLFSPRSYVPRILCSRGPMFPRPYIARVPCSQGPMYQWSYVPRVLYSQGPMFPGSYVSWDICSRSCVLQLPHTLTILFCIRKNHNPRPDWPVTLSALAFVMFPFCLMTVDCWLFSWLQLHHIVFDTHTWHWAQPVDVAPVKNANNCISQKINWVFWLS